MPDYVQFLPKFYKKYGTTVDQIGIKFADMNCIELDSFFFRWGKKTFFLSFQESVSLKIEAFSFSIFYFQENRSSFQLK